MHNEWVKRGSLFFRVLTLSMSAAQIAFGVIFLGAPLYLGTEYWLPAFYRFMNDQFTEKESALVLFGAGAFGAVFAVIGFFTLFTGLREAVRVLSGDNESFIKKAKRESEGRRAALREQLLQEAGGRWKPVTEYEKRREPIDLAQSRMILENGAYVLQTRGIYQIAFFAISIFALFWNGVVLSGTWEAPALDSVFGVFQLVFMLPFYVVGAALVFGAGYFFLLSRHPSMKIELAHPELKLGSEARIRWSFDEKSTQLDRMTVTLEATEVLIKGTGDAETKMSETIFSKEIASSIPLRALDHGEIAFVMPDEAEPTGRFVGREVRWSVNIHAIAKGAPDLRFSLPVQVNASEPVKESSEMR